MEKCSLYKDGKCPYLGLVECHGIILWCDCDWDEIEVDQFWDDYEKRNWTQFNQGKD